MHLEFSKKEEEIKRKTEEEVRARIAAEEEEKKRRQTAIRDAEEAADEAKRVATAKWEAEEKRKIEKAESKKAAMRMAIRRQADEVLARQEYKEKIAKAARKYALIQKRAKHRRESSDSESSDDE